MKVINILKDGTVVQDMSTVSVPCEIVNNIFRIAEGYQRKRSVDINGQSHKTENN